MASAALLRNKLRRIERELEEFETDYSPDGIINRLQNYRAEIQQYRQQGYEFFQEEVEGAIENLVGMIEERRQFLNRHMDDNVRRIMREMRQASYYTNLSDDASEALLERADNEVDDAERKLDEAKRSYINSLDPLADTEKRIKKLMKRIPYYFEMKDEASFDFAADEQVVMADKAEWVVTGKGKEDPDGILFLTNQRMVFEQKEKTGKTFGLFGGKMQHGIQWEYSLDQIAGVSYEDKGMLGRKDMLMLQMQSGAEHDEITLESKGDDDNSEWHAVIEKALNGGLA